MYSTVLPHEYLHVIGCDERPNPNEKLNVKQELEHGRNVGDDEVTVMSSFGSNFGLSQLNKSQKAALCLNFHLSLPSEPTQHPPQVEEGIYQIKNIETSTIVHTFKEGENVIVAGAPIRYADPGVAGLWLVSAPQDSPKSNLRVLKNISLNSAVSVGVEDSGVQTMGKPVPFIIEPVDTDVPGHLAFMIKHPDNERVWTIPRQPFIRGDVGSPSAKKWRG
uniref:Uncharacterized protein n=1 Tax=Moniliophthora roreri TaxID=221103 RepID=A0A0W0EUY6_MONRR